MELKGKYTYHINEETKNEPKIKIIEEESTTGDRILEFLGE